MEREAIKQAIKEAATTAHHHHALDRATDSVIKLWDQSVLDALTSKGCPNCASLRVEVERLRGRNLSLESDRNLRWRLRDELEEELGVKGLEIDDQLQKALEVIKDLRRAGKV